MNAREPGITGRNRTQDIYELSYLVVFHDMLKFSPFMALDLLEAEKTRDAEGPFVHTKGSQRFTHESPFRSVDVLSRGLIAAAASVRSRGQTEAEER